MRSARRSRWLFLIAVVLSFHASVVPTAWAPPVGRPHRPPIRPPHHFPPRPPWIQPTESLRPTESTWRPEITRRPVSEEMARAVRRFESNALEASRLEVERFEALYNRVVTGEASLPSGVSKENMKSFLDDVKKPALSTTSANRFALMGSRPIPSSDGLSEIFRVTKTDAGLLEDFKFKPLRTSKLEDKPNSEVLQKNPVKGLVRPDGKEKPLTTVVRKNDPLDTSLVVRYSKPTDFVAKMESTPERFQFNMLRLKNRLPSRRVKIFDFSPQSARALQDMGLTSTDLTTWQSQSASIARSVKDLSGGHETLGPRSVEALLQELRDDKGTVVILYTHSDGTNLFLDLGDRTFQLSPTFLKEKLGSLGNSWAPTVVLLNCEADPILAKAFLDANSPLVFATDQKIPIDEASTFTRSILDSVYSKQLDAVDAVFEAIKAKGPARLGPIAEDDAARAKIILANNKVPSGLLKFLGPSSKSLLVASDATVFPALHGCDHAFE